MHHASCTEVVADIAGCGACLRLERVGGTGITGRGACLRLERAAATLHAAAVAGAALKLARGTGDAAPAGCAAAAGALLPSGAVEVARLARRLAGTFVELAGLAVEARALALGEVVLARRAAAGVCLAGLCTGGTELSSGTGGAIAILGSTGCSRLVLAGVTGRNHATRCLRGCSLELTSRATITTRLCSSCLKLTVDAVNACGLARCGLVLAASAGCACATMMLCKEFSCL